MLGAAEAGEGEHSHARLNIEPTRLLRRAESNLRQVLGRGFDVDRGIGQEVQIALAGDDDIQARYLVDSFANSDHLQGRTNRVGIILGYAGDDGIGIPHADHHRAEDVVIVHQFVGGAQCHAAALPQPIQLPHIVLPPRCGFRFDDCDTIEGYPQLRSSVLDLIPPSQKHWNGDLLLDQNVTGTQDLLVRALRENHPLGIRLRLVNHDPHQFVRLAQTLLELFAVFHDIHRILRHPGVHGGLGYRSRFPNQYTRIERRGNDVVPAKLQSFHTVGAANRVGNIFLRQRGQGMSCRQLHFFIDGRGMYVKGTAEEEREPEDVVDLVGVIRASGGHDDVVTDSACFFVGDLRVGIGQREDHRIGRHRRDHLRRECALYGKTQQKVSALRGLSQRPQRGVLGELLFVRIHPFFAALVNDALGVNQSDVLALHAHADVVLSGSNAGSAGAVDDNLNLVQALARQLHRIEQRCASDNRGAVLIVVENRDFHRLLEGFLDVEALRRFDVFQVDAAEGGLKQLAGFDNLVGIVSIQFDVEYIDTGKSLEQDTFAFHDRL